MVSAWLTSDARRGKARQQQPVRFARQRVCLDVKRRRRCLRRRAPARSRGRLAPRSSPAGVRHATEDPRRAVGLLEQLGRLADTLGGTKKQHALRTKRVVERSQDPALGDIVEIDEEIAAADQGPIARTADRASRPDARRDRDRECPSQCGNRCCLPDEEALEAFSRDVLQDIGVIDARARLLQRRFTDIGPENLDLSAAGGRRDTREAAMATE